MLVEEMIVTEFLRVRENSILEIPDQLKIVCQLPSGDTGLALGFRYVVAGLFWFEVDDRSESAVDAG
jgi:hypothetical protein